MLSILIPIYNYDCRSLVKDLHKQCTVSDIPFEIRLIDDCSDHFQKENQSLSTLQFVHFTALSTNIGRSAIRNQLAQEAKYEYLLFIDCDAGTCNNYIAKYLPFLPSDKIICGGLLYDIKDYTPEKSLRFQYGHKREEKSAQTRNKTPYQAFTSFNMLIPKKVFLAIKFDESITKYGHEDTLFGIMLEKEKKEILHINNPLYHKGIENNIIFLQKTQQSILSLKELYERAEYSSQLSNKIKILSFYKKIKPLHIPISFLFTSIRPLIEKYLITNKKPSLIVFDFYKLGYLCTSMQNSK